MKKIENIFIKVKSAHEMYSDLHSTVMEEIQKNIINQIMKQQDEFIEYVLRNFVTPPIKGEITKGKIKWRGLEIVNDIQSSTIYIKQRGNLIPISMCYKKPFKL